MKNHTKLLIGAFTLLMTGLVIEGCTQVNTDPEKAQLYYSDVENFWITFEKAKPTFDIETLNKYYFDKGTPGLRSMLKQKIRGVENLQKKLIKNYNYYSSIKGSTDGIDFFAYQIYDAFKQMKSIYPKATFPDVYFVIGALNSGGTTSKKEIIIGAEMYGLTQNTPKEELSPWLNTVLKPMKEMPYIVAHELVHVQQKYDGSSLLAASIKEGAADFIGEMISGKHINQHVHDFANPIEKELWLEFKQKMNSKDLKGWLYSETPGRPNDLGYWMGYKITKSYYDHATDKQKAINDIITIKDFKKFLAGSHYEEGLNKQASN